MSDLDSQSLELLVKIANHVISRGGGFRSAPALAHALLGEEAALNVLAGEDAPTVLRRLHQAAEVVMPTIPPRSLGNAMARTGSAAAVQAANEISVESRSRMLIAALHHADVPLDGRSALSMCRKCFYGHAISFTLLSLSLCLSISMTLHRDMPHVYCYSLLQ